MEDTSALEHTMVVSLEDTTVVPYPEKELSELRKVIAYDGVLKLIQQTAHVSPPTVKKIAKDGLGRNGKVKSLREFVVGYLNAVA